MNHQDLITSQESALSTTASSPIQVDIKRWSYRFQRFQEEGESVEEIGIEEEEEIKSSSREGE